MTLPTEPVTLTVEQIKEFSRKLSTLRHDVNNQLSLISASVELIRHRPDSVERLLKVVAEQPQKISESVMRFSDDVESALRITRT